MLAWTIEGQTGWKRPHPAYLCQDGAVLERVKLFTYNAGAPGFNDYCISRFGQTSESTVGRFTAAQLQDLWDLFTPLRHCTEVCRHDKGPRGMYRHGLPLDGGLFLTFYRGPPILTDYRTGMGLGAPTYEEAARKAGGAPQLAAMLAKLPTLNNPL